ncbi:DUF833-domain-containing protein [Flagelloscypha sp. PMI_526]|nr:DUF833-domain-containing protein [Flagelloscypha sp. PMI_526]
MCIVFWTLEHPDYELILCTNRDEFFHRPTSAAAWRAASDIGHDGIQKVLCGLDDKAGGTWCGIAEDGKVAILTNITEPLDGEFSTSRGHLVSKYLAGDENADIYSRKLVAETDMYRGFNLLLIDPFSDVINGSSHTKLVTNGGRNNPIRRRRKIGVLSNGVDGTDDWPKEGLVEKLFSMLGWHPDEKITERSQLRNTIAVLPLPITASQAPEFYGTRLSTVILIRRDGSVLFIERDVWVLEGEQVDRGNPGNDRRYEFSTKTEL